MFHALQVVYSQVAQEDLLAPFKNIVTPQMLQFMRETITQFGPYSYQSSAFTPGAFPFEAYQLAETEVVPLATKGGVNA